MEIAANQKNYRMKQSWRQASMQVLNSSVARPWKLEQNTSGQASRQALRASRLWKLEQNNMKKKGPLFGPQNVRFYQDFNLLNTYFNLYIYIYIDFNKKTNFKVWLPIESSFKLFCKHSRFILIPFFACWI